MLFIFLKRKNLRQIAVLTNIEKAHTPLFYSDNDLIILSVDGVFLYSIPDGTLKRLSFKRYNCGYVSLEKKIYLVSKDRLDVFKNFQIEKEVALQKDCRSIVVTSNSLILGASDGTLVSIKDADQGSPKIFKLLNGPIDRLSINEGENMLAVASTSDYRDVKIGEALIWDMNSEKVVFKQDGFNGQVESVYIDEKKAIISSYYSINIYDLNGRIISAIDTTPFPNPIFSIYKEKLVYGIAHIEPYRNLFEITLGSSPSKRTFSHDGIQVWDISSYKDKVVLTKDNETTTLTSSGEVQTHEIVAGQKDILFKYPPQITGIKIHNQKITDSLIVYSLDSGSLMTSALPEELSKWKFYTDFVSYDNQLFAINNSCLQNITNREILIEFNTTCASATASHQNVGLHPNLKPPIRKFVIGKGELLFYEFNATDSSLLLRRISNGDSLKYIKGVRRILATQENGMILLFTNNQLASLDISTFEILKLNVPNASDSYMAKFNSRKKLLAVKYGEFLGNEVVIVNLMTKQTIPLKSIYPNIDCIEFSPNDKYLLTSTRSGVVEIWNAASGMYEGVVFTGFLKDDFVIILGQNYDGTGNGISNLINTKRMAGYERKKGLITSLFLK